MSFLATQEFKTVLTAAQLLTLNSNPVLLVPGRAGCLIELQSLYMRFIYGGTAFNPGPNDELSIYLGPAVSTNPFGQYILVSAQGLVDQTADQAVWQQPTWGGSGGVVFPPLSYVGSGISITEWDDDGANSFPTGTNWSQGNGELAVFIKYAYVEVS